MSDRALKAVATLRGLSKPERVVLLNLAIWYSDKSLTTFRAQSLLAADCEIAPGNVSRVLSGLCQRGILELAQKAHQNYVARYRMPFVELASSVRGTALSDQDEDPSPVRGTELNDPTHAPSPVRGTVPSPVPPTLSPVLFAPSPVPGTADLRDLELEKEKKKTAAAPPAVPLEKGKPKKPSYDPDQLNDQIAALLKGRSMPQLDKLDDDPPSRHVSMPGHRPRRAVNEERAFERSPLPTAPAAMLHYRTAGANALAHDFSPQPKRVAPPAPPAPPAEREDWWDECKRIHGLACGGRWNHDARKRGDEWARLHPEELAAARAGVPA